ncbi:MAG: type I DNA topoisomerase [Candidatus Falkowbacteria bacterium]
MNLIIVESPTKAKTISKFLGSAYKVESSFGHIRDLPVSTMGVDIEHDFQPSYVVPDKAKKNLNNLKKLAEKADEIILASDEDREGEAIAWHLSEALKLDSKKAKRIVFHEITKAAILGALEHPRVIDQRLVDAQQARRILDRLVGYELSPFLWKKVARGLSAGRVQSVAVRLIVEREREIKAFNCEEYWSITGDFSKTEDKAVKFSADLNKISGKTVEKMFIKNQEQADAIVNSLNDAKYEVSKVEYKDSKKKAPTPFTTSTLQQTANRFLGFSAKQTMMVAQKLYEQGFITYMRTDSQNLSAKFITDAYEYLIKELGKDYAIAGGQVFKTKSKNAQEAHEAVRPTEVSNNPEDLKAKLDPNQYRLYKLIWQRSVATQMPPALLAVTVIDIAALDTPYSFRASGQVLKFEGYLKIYPESTKDQTMPNLVGGDKLNLEKLGGTQHFTAPPARYSDAGLVKEMEKYGIGRPSTYAPTISTIIDRNYVFRDDKKRLAPTEIAFVVIDLLVAHFHHIVDYKFTAEMENNLDEVAVGKKDWVPVIADFYNPFHKNLEEKYKEVNKENIMPEETSSEVCDKCGSPMIVKTGRYGKFLACSNYPACKNIKSSGEPKPGMVVSPEAEAKLKALQEKFVGIICDKCGSAMTVKNGKFGPFLACTAYPGCKNLKNIPEDDAVKVTCPACGKGEIVKKFSRRGAFYACSAYPDCKNAYWGKPTGEKCPECQSLLIEDKDGTKCSDKACGFVK